MTTTPDPSDRTPRPAPRPPARKPDLSDLAAAVRSIERGENPVAPAPRGDAAAARRKRKEAMAAEAAAFQAAEAAEAAGTTAPAATPDTPEEANAAADEAPTGVAEDGSVEPASRAHDDRPTDNAPAEPGTSDAPHGGPAAEEAAPDPAHGQPVPGNTPAGHGTSDNPDGGRAAEGSAPDPAQGARRADADNGRTAKQAAHGTAARARPGTGNAPAGEETSDSPGSGRTAKGAAPDPAHGQPVPDNTPAGHGTSDGPGSPRPGGAAEPAASGPAGHARSSASNTPAGQATSGNRRGGAGNTPGGTGTSAPAAGLAAGLGGGQDPTRGRGVVDAAAVEAAETVLAQGGAPKELAVVAVRALGEGAAGELRADPWRVLGFEGVRVGVEQVDAFARAVLGAACGPGDERRVRALIGHVMERAAGAGHTALTAEALRAALARHAVPDPAEALAAAVEEGQLLVFGGQFEEDPADGDEAGDEPAAGPVLVALDRYALAEESLADGCVRLLRSFEGADGREGTDWEGAAAAAPSTSAAELIRTVAAHALVLHTGGEAARAEPTALVAAARAAGLRAYAAAYTENGRRRLAADLGEEAALTVAGLLAGGRAPDGSLPVDLVAVLDAPQLSVEEAATLVEALPDGARLVLSGDPYAIWSAGPGRAFADLLAAKVCPRVTSRTPDPGPIGELTSCVGEGELARVDAPDREVMVVPVRDPGEAVHRAVQLVADSVPRAFGLAPGRVQVVTVAHGGPAGTRALNAALKERLNPGPGRFAGFDPGDRVVHVPAPGRAYPGTVAGAEPDGLRLECEAGPVLVPREDVAATVRHGWALTCHQAAGMRWPAVVVVVPGDAGPLIGRSWVYTAFSRGERHLSVVQGADQGLGQAVVGPLAAPRTTRLAAILTAAP